MTSKEVFLHVLRAYACVCGSGNAARTSLWYDENESSQGGGSAFDRAQKTSQTLGKGRGWAERWITK